MRTCEILSRLNGVKPTGEGRWQARCPAHPDKHPSLTVKEGERGLLIKCWTGCELEAVCRAIGVEIQELFYDNKKPTNTRRSHQRASSRFHSSDSKNFEAWLQHEADTAFLRSEQVFKQARGLDVSQWTSEQLEEAWSAVDIAMTELALSATLRDLQFEIASKRIYNQKNGPGWTAPGQKNERHTTSECYQTPFTKATFQIGHARGHTL